jgi:2-amino-4-hydroxy-6-hydroxymethyldihydropteridine diphosphokinase
VAIGTNLPFEGLAGAALAQAALVRLDNEGLPALAVSAFHTTAAWPDPADPPFTNAVAVLHAGARDAQAVLAVLLGVEAAFGRTRGARNAPRTLDLDLLDLDGQVLEAPGVTLPHPRLHLRRFVLAPLAEAAPGWRHPILGSTAGELLEQLG